MFVFKDFTRHVKLAARPTAPTDNLVFRLHYRLTFWFLLACCLLVSSKQFIKDHISCLVERSIQPVINSFCFFSSTFTVFEHYGQPNVVAAHPGVGPYTGREQIRHHAYYQWVPFVLFFQAILFYAPHYLWKQREARRLQIIADYLGDRRPDILGKTVDPTKTRWFTMERLTLYRDWAKWLVFCEFLNITNVMFQVWLIDTFLQGSFLSLGFSWLRDQQLALDIVFPKVTKCSFHKYGPSGSIQNYDALCVMSLNIVNEKIYCILWFWMVILTVVSILGMIWRLVTFTCHSRSVLFNTLLWHETIATGSPSLRSDVQLLTSYLCYSDWLLIRYLGDAINPAVFRLMLSCLAKDVVNERRQKVDLENSTGEDPKESESFC